MPRRDLPRTDDESWVVVPAAAVGIVGGIGTFLAEGVGGPVWLSVVHTLTPWAMLTVGVGFVVRKVWWLAAAAGLAAQLGLVVGYYASKSLTWLPFATGSAITYGIVALFAGPVYGAAAVGLQPDRAWVRTLSLGVVSAPWIFDGTRMAMAALDIGTQVDLRLTISACFVVIGLCLPLLINRLVPLTDPWVEREPS